MAGTKQIYKYPLDLENLDSEQHYVKFVIYERANRIGKAKAVKTQKIIYLYIPETIRNQHQFSYDGVNTAGSKQTSAALQGGITEAMELLKRQGSVAVESLKNQLGGLLTGDQNAAGADLASTKFGRIVNPHMEFVFRNPTERNFTFDFKFSPRSEQEAREIEEIMKILKKYSHPELTGQYTDGNSEEASGGDNLFYKYPSEFDISFYSGGSFNKYLPQIKQAVVTGINDDYAPNGVFSSFKNGFPTQINLSITFKELRILDRNTVNE